MPPFLNRIKRSVEHTIRQRSARRFLVALKRSTHRLPSTLHAPVQCRVLVVAPHADDEIIPCGGTLLRHRQLGSPTRVVFATDSSAGIADPAIAQRVRQCRHGESLLVADAMRFDSVVRLELPDGALVRHEANLAALLAEQIRLFRPDVIYCPFPGDAHADHQACALALAQASQETGWKGTVHAYEVWTALWPNTVVDISDQAEEKARLIRLYASQMADRDYAAGTLGLNRFRGLQHRLAYAEAFYACSAAEFHALAGLLNQWAPSPLPSPLHSPAPALEMPRPRTGAAVAPAESCATAAHSTP